MLKVLLKLLRRPNNINMSKPSKNCLLLLRMLRNPDLLRLIKSNNKSNRNTYLQKKNFSKLLNMLRKWLLKSPLKQNPSKRPRVILLVNNKPNWWQSSLNRLKQLLLILKMDNSSRQNKKLQFKHHNNKLQLLLKRKLNKSQLLQRKLNRNRWLLKQLNKNQLLLKNKFKLQNHKKRKSPPLRSNQKFRKLKKKLLNQLLLLRKPMLSQFTLHLLKIWRNFQNLILKHQSKKLSKLKKLQ